MTDRFQFRDETLHVEEVPLDRLAAEVGTPFYVYSATAVREQFEALRSAFEGMPTLIAYAMKANSNQAILRLLGGAGAGADVVSLGELERAVAADIPPDRIVFSGVAKTAAEMRRGLGLGIRCFNVESEPELQRLAAVAAGMGAVAPVSVRINPDVDAGTHAKISTGKAEDKFGVPPARARQMYRQILADDSLVAVGVDTHIGSQISDLAPFAQTFELLCDFVRELRRDGHQIRHVDVGGGLGIAYEDGGATPPTPVAYAALVRENFAPLGVELVVEPGRLIVGNAGVLVTRVEYVKEGAKLFVIVDAGMNDLLRPTLYSAHHEIVPVRHANRAAVVTDIVGPVCESGDFLAQDRLLPGVVEGDLLAVKSAGAYGAVMSSTYNARPLVPEVLVDGDRYHVVRPRPTIASLIALDSVPDWV